MIARHYRQAASAHARLLRACALAASLSLTAACSRDPRKEERQELQTLSSWAGALRLLAESWGEGSAPSRYAAKTADEARESLREELRTVQRSSSVSDEARAAFARHAQAIDALAAALAQAARGGSREQAAQLVVQLSGEQDAVDALARGAGAAPR